MKNIRPYIIPFFISFQGCPFTCIYCQQETITAHPSRLPSGEEIPAKIQAYLRTRAKGRYDQTQVAFYGGTFTGLNSKERLLLYDAVRPFLRNGQVDGIRVSTKPDLVNSSVLQEGRARGLRVVELGVQSLDDGVLQKVGRGYNARQVQIAVEELRRAGLQVGIQLMPGLPGADAAEAEASARQTIALAPDFVRIYPTVVLRGTGLEHLYRRGEYRPWTLEKALTVCGRLKKLFQSAHIPIIKMGLEFSSEEAAEIIAGPYHPHFHQRVA